MRLRAIGSLSFAVGAHELEGALLSRAAGCITSTAAADGSPHGGANSADAAATLEDEAGAGE